MSNTELLILGGAALAVFYFMHKGQGTSASTSASAATQPSTAQSAQDGASAANGIDGSQNLSFSGNPTASQWWDSFLNSVDYPVPGNQSANMNNLSPMAQQGA